MPCNRALQPPLPPPSRTIGSTLRLGCCDEAPTVRCAFRRRAGSGSEARPRPRETRILFSSSARMTVIAADSLLNVSTNGLCSVLNYLCIF
ncbi:hypothetical protein M758_2G159400 [Ceratodon purpureus]|nr:hypothetical protein M758_2G159400 [Ceratodon purpureus]